MERLRERQRRPEFRERQRKYRAANRELERERHRRYRYEWWLRDREQNAWDLQALHPGDPKAKKLIALMFDPSATDGEREACRLALRKRLAIRSANWHIPTTPPKENSVCQPSQTMSAVTRNTHSETKSLSASANSRGE